MAQRHLPANKDTIILEPMSSQKPLKKAPTALQFLLSPVESAQIVELHGKGMGWILLLWALDFFLQSPLTVSRWVLRSSESPVSGVTTLWSIFVNASLPQVGAAIALGTFFYYQRRRSQHPVELWNSIIIAGYCFAPHTLLVGLSALLGHLGLDNPWLLHHRDPSSSLSDAQLMIGSIPVLFYWWMCLKSSSSPLSLRRRTQIRTLALIIGFGAVALTSRFIYENPEKARPLMNGDSLPTFSIVDAQGQNRVLSETIGKTMLIDVWATWCGPCVAAMPQLEQIHQKYSGDDFEMISLNTEPDRIQHVLNFIDKNNLSFPVFFDHGQARRSLMISLYPTIILVDQQGKIRSIYNGTLGLSNLENDIERVLKTEK